MIISPANLANLFVTFDLSFNKGFGETESVYQEFSTVVPSSAEKNIYPWLGMIPGLREWLGQRHINNLAGRSYELVNKDWEGTIAVPRNVIEDDQYGLYGMNLQMLGVAAKQHADKLMASVLEAGTTALCYDGQPFFHNSHPVDVDTASAGTFQNNYDNTSTGGSATFPFTPTNYALARGYLAGFKAENGTPYGIEADTLVVPAGLEYAARQVLNADMIAPAGAFGINAAGGFQSNILKGSAKLVVNRFLTNQTAWYVMSTKMPIKPLVFQKRTEPRLAQLTKPEDVNVFMRKEYIYGVECRDNGGYTLPFLAIRGNA